MKGKTVKESEGTTITQLIYDVNSVAQACINQK